MADAYRSSLPAATKGSFVGCGCVNIQSVIKNVHNAILQDDSELLKTYEIADPKVPLVLVSSIFNIICDEKWRCAQHILESFQHYDLPKITTGNLTKCLKLLLENKQQEILQRVLLHESMFDRTCTITVLIRYTELDDLLGQYLRQPHALSHKFIKLALRENLDNYYALLPLVGHELLARIANQVYAPRDDRRTKQPID